MVEVCTVAAVPSAVAVVGAMTAGAVAAAAVVTQKLVVAVMRRCNAAGIVQAPAAVWIRTDSAA